MEADLISLVDELSGRLEVLGVALFGSSARGDNRPDSDIDVYVLVDEASWRDVEARSDQRFEFVYASEKASRAFWQASPDEFVQQWTDARILLDKHGKLNAFRKEAEELRKEGRSALDGADGQTPSVRCGGPASCSPRLDWLGSGDGCTRAASAGRGAHRARLLPPARVGAGSKGAPHDSAKPRLG